MKCPKCKTEITNKDAFCPNCNLKLIIECPKCKGKVRLGSVSCKSCGYVFVKFCPRCNSANYVSSPTCRKCFYVFEEEIKEDIFEPDNSKEEVKFEDVKGDINIDKNEEKKDVKNRAEAPQVPPSKAIYTGDKRLEFLIDFLNLSAVFKKFKDEDFKEKVLLNIKTSIKVAFGASAEFYRENIARFKIGYNPNNGIYDKILKFNAEIDKFNTFLNETLGAEITHKFVILAMGEFDEDKPAMQLAVGHDRDIITSKAAYEILSGEISLVKTSPDSYKMANVENDSKEAISAKELDEDAALDALYTAITEDNQIKGISINAPRGTGKTYLLSKLYDKLKDSNVAILSAKCSAMSQVAPLGLFQNVFLNLFNLPFAPVDYKKTTDEFRALIKKYLPEGYQKEKVETLINLIYPTKRAFYEKLETNKSLVYSHIKDILETLRMNAKVLLSIDDFDLIDETSFEFLLYLIKGNFFVDGSKFLLCYRNQNTLNMYIPPEILGAKECLDISLKKQKIGSTRAYIKKCIGDVSVLPRKISDQIIMNSKGDLAYTGQVLYYLEETGKLKRENGKLVFAEQFEDFFIPQTMAEVIKNRLEFLFQKSQMEFCVLNLASFLGGAFTKSLIKEAMAASDEELDEALLGLEQSGYITKIDNENYSFKNSLVWTNIYIYAKGNKEIRPYIKSLLKILNARIISSPAICALLAQIAEDKEGAFALWTKNLQTASAIGDSALYAMSQKQSFVNLEEIVHPNKDYIKNNIYERLGKLTYKKNPVAAVQYLSNAIIEAKAKDNAPKVIELSGYLVQSCRLSQNYKAVIETIDNILDMFQNKPKFEIQQALIKTRKLEALLNTGNYEEIANIVNTEINPVLSEVLRTRKKLPFIAKDNLYKSWIEANITLSLAYSYQGSPLAFELLDVIEKEIFKDSKNINSELTKKFKLSCSLAYTMKGLFDQSDEILHALIKDFSPDDKFLISKWNMITLFNKVLRADFENIKEDLFEAVTYANNNGDNLTKNILKTVLAYVISEDDPLRALEICQEQMAYFSDEKIALGALIAWYASAKSTLKTSGPLKAIEICEKSIQISENPKICTLWFKVLFQIFMSECYILKGDLESAKMYTELASQDVNQCELNYFMLKIVRLRAIIMQDSIDKAPEDKKQEVAASTVKMFEKAISLSTKLNLKNFQNKIQKELTSFKASCKLKRINLKDE